MNMHPARVQRAEEGVARFSPDRLYRYTLTRVWDTSRPRLMWIGLNPSTADERQLDPTLRRVLRFSDGFGYGGFEMTNLFAIRSTDPAVLRVATDPVGPENDHWLRRVASESDTVVCAWGVDGPIRGRDKQVLELLRDFDRLEIKCLKTTKDGHPRHPLYLPSITPLESFDG